MEHSMCILVLATSPSKGGLATLTYACKLTAIRQV